MVQAKGETTKVRVCSPKMGVASFEHTWVMLPWTPKPDRLSWAQ